MTRAALLDIRRVLRGICRDITQALGERPALEKPPRRGRLSAVEVARWLEGALARGELPRLPDGRVYVTQALVLDQALGIPPEVRATLGTATHEALVELGWQRGDRFRVAGAKVTPYWPPVDRVEEREASPQEGRRVATLGGSKTVA